MLCVTTTSTTSTTSTNAASGVSPTAVDHIGVIVRSIDVAKKFLGESLGLPLVKETYFPERGTKAAFFQLGSCEVEVIECLREEARQKPDSVTEMLASNTLPSRLRSSTRLLEHLGGVGAEMDAEPIVYDGDLMSFSLPATTMGVRFQFMEKGVDTDAHVS